MKALPFLILLAILVVRAEQDERSFFHEHAAAEVDNATLTENDVAQLESLQARRRARMAAEGHADRQRWNHPIRAQVDLVRLHIHGFEDFELLEDQRNFMADLRSDQPSGDRN